MAIHYEHIEKDCPAERTNKARKEEQRHKALELRIAGASYGEIARELGFSSPERVYDCISFSLKKLSIEPTNELRTLELMRMDALMEALWAGRGRPDFADRILKVMSSRARLLGLDAPSKIQMEKAEENENPFFGMSDDELREAVQQAAASLAAGGIQIQMEPTREA